MRRCICITEPSTALAGQTHSWRFSFSPSINLPAKTILRFDPSTQGKEGDWQVPEVGPKAKKNTIWLTLSNGQVVQAKEAEDKEGFKFFDFVLPSSVSQGDKLVINMGAQDPKESNKDGNQSQTFLQRRRPFNLYIDTKGKGDFKEPEVFTIDVRGNVLKNIRIITPSVVFKNSRFDIFIRFEDAYGNLTGNAPEGTLVELTYEQLRENLNWKLFVPETGFLTLPNLYFNEPGIYELKLTNLMTKEEYFSAPIKCFLEEGDQLFWGVLHGESKRFDTLTNTESELRHMRDDQALQFFSSSVLESEGETSNDNWKLASAQIAEFNEEERFVTMLGFQWNGEPSTEGLRHFIYPKDNKPILRKKDVKCNNLKKIYKSHTPKELLAIPSFTMSDSCSYNFEGYQPDFERVVEIYNAWGSSECTAKKGNTKPIKSKNKKGVNENEEGSILEALKKGCRFGFIAGGFDKRGVYEELDEETQNLYTSGLTAIFSPVYSREAIFLALYNRRCYATTGPRILLSFNIAKEPMGSELDTKVKPGLVYNRHIHGFVAGTDTIEEVVIYRNGASWKTIQSKDSYAEIALDDEDPIEKIALKVDPEKRPFVFYHLKVKQKDGHIAWASPIWIDVSPSEEKKKTKKK